MNELEQYRKQIDEIDNQLVDLIVARKKVVENVATYKKQHGQVALQPVRFEAVLARVKDRGQKQDLDPLVLEGIWNELHRYFLKIENDRI